MGDLSSEQSSELMFPEATMHTCTDSSIHPYQTDRWGINNSSLGDYSWSIFGEDNQDRLGEFLDDRIGEGERTAIDIAGGTDGRAMQELLELGVVSSALVTNLLDRRNEAARSYPGLHHVEGDILLRTTWRAIDGWRSHYAPEGVDVILHRPVGGLQHLDPLFYQQAAHYLLDMLRPGGVMIAQVPNILAPYPNLSSQQLLEIEDTIKARADTRLRTVVGDVRKYAFFLKD